MGKVKAMYMEQESYDYDYDEALEEYQRICWQEMNQTHQLTKEEETAYQLYMKGELCGEQINTVPTSESINSLTGQSKGIRLRRKRNSNG